MSLISCDYRCFECDHTYWETISRDIMFSYSPECAQCGAEMRRVPSGPRVMRKSYPDGSTKRFTDMKEAARLRCDMADLPGDQREGIRKEIDKLEGRKTDD